MDLASIPLVDHHAHPLLHPAATGHEAAFRRWFSESSHPIVHERDVPHSLFFRTSLRWLSELLDCEGTLLEILEARAARSYESWITELFDQANISHLLCDYGYGGSEAYSHEEMKRLVPCDVRPILRLETLAEQLFAAHDRFEELANGYLDVVGRARQMGYVALKSIIAYRSGLGIGCASEDQAARAFVALKEEVGPGHTVRLDSKPLGDFLVRHAVELAGAQNLPVQFHTGFGDNDADLRRANPLHLRPLIEEFETPLVLLHAGWPFYREAAHLTAIYPHLWLDLSLAIPFATAGIPAMLRDILGMVPFNKILFATDAYTMPEIFWLAARWGRWGLGRVLGDFVAEGFLDEAEAWSAAEAILGANARRLYL